uniref:PHD-type domain-containing protein n=1 Tax=Gasterosteus aculeatus TaxID=69293 RepID=G3NEK0_GASAC
MYFILHKKKEMDNRSKVECVLCQKCEETKVTGALSTKDEVTAHQNCLLFSSGLVCSSSPQFDDLFGFSVGDVLAEVKRGSKLMCSRCQLRGATAGCEVRRCKKSYHYPCAVQHKANVVEDADKGKYVLYCSKHSEPTQNNKSSVNGRPSSVTGSQTVIKTINQSEAGPSKVGLMGISTVTVRPSNSKRRLSFPDKQEGIPSKRTPKVLTDDSSNSDEPDKDMASFGPIETDSFEAEVNRNGDESPDASTSGPPAVNRTMAGPKDDEDTILLSDAESESLLLPASPSSRSVPTLYPSVILLGSEEEPARLSSEGSSPDLSSAGRPSPPRRVAVDATPPDTAGLPL